MTASSPIADGKSVLDIFLRKPNARIRYAATFLLEESLGLKLNWISDTETFRASPFPKLSLDSACTETLYIALDPWLTDYVPSVLEYEELEGKWNMETLPTYPYPFFPQKDSLSALNFDPFSASFFLLSRYEEYRKNVVEDAKGRYVAENSILFKSGLLEKPLVDIWADLLKKILSKAYPQLQFAPCALQILPTIDIDRGYYILHKPLYKQIGGFFKYKGETMLRLKTLLHLRQDPFVNFDEILSIHRNLGLETRFFIHCGDYDSIVDAGHAPRIKAYQKKLRTLNAQEKVKTGIHFSLASNTRTYLLQKELEYLENLLQTKVQSNRQHFIALKIPQTYRNLLRLGITEDFSMGYPDSPGFRAGTSRAFCFYDLLKDEETSLKVQPFCCMDATLTHYLHLNREESFQKMETLLETLQSVNGTFSYIFHNESLSETGPWKGWRRAYVNFLSMCRASLDNKG